jgi:hypothetical protein
MKLIWRVLGVVLMGLIAPALMAPTCVDYSSGQNGVPANQNTIKILLCDGVGEPLGLATPASGAELWSCEADVQPYYNPNCDCQDPGTILSNVPVAINGTNLFAEPDAAPAACLETALRTQYALDPNTISVIVSCVFVGYAPPPPPHAPTVALLPEDEADTAEEGSGSDGGGGGGGGGGD